MTLPAPLWTVWRVSPTPSAPLSITTGTTSTTGSLTPSVSCCSREHFKLALNILKMSNLLSLVRQSRFIWFNYLFLFVIFMQFSVVFRILFLHSPGWRSYSWGVQDSFSTFTWLEKLFLGGSGFFFYIHLAGEAILGGFSILFLHSPGWRSYSWGVQYSFSTFTWLEKLFLGGSGFFFYIHLAGEAILGGFSILFLHSPGWRSYSWGVQYSFSTFTWLEKLFLGGSGFFFYIHLAGEAILGGFSILFLHSPGWRSYSWGVQYSFSTFTWLEKLFLGGSVFFFYIHLAGEAILGGFSILFLHSPGWRSYSWGNPKSTYRNDLS